jgi:hypothetical protein
MAHDALLQNSALLTSNLLNGCGSIMASATHLMLSFIYTHTSNSSSGLSSGTLLMSRSTTSQVVAAVDTHK